MKDDDLLAHLRSAAEDEERAYAAWHAEHARALEPAPELTDRLVGQLLSERRSPDREPERAPTRRRARYTRTMGVTAASLVAAGALGWVLLRAPPHEPGPLPEFVASIERGAEAQSRHEEGAPRKWFVRGGAPFELVLRPATRVPEPLEVTATLTVAGKTRALPVSARAGSAGVVTVTGEWPKLGAGDAELLLGVRRHGDDRAATREGAWRSVHVVVEFLP